MGYTEGIKTFQAGEDLAAKRRVRIMTDSPATTTDPPEVVYADAGEDFIGVTEYAASSGDLVAVKLNSAPGTFECCCTVNSAIARGTVLYGAADGKISDASSGTAQGIAMEAAGASNDIIEVAFWNVKATTAATVSVADSGNIITGVTVEAALAEIMTGIKTAQYTLTPDRMSAEDGTALTVYAASPAGVGIAQLSNKSSVIQWTANATPNDIVAHFTMPQDLDDTADLVLHLLGALSAASPANTPTFTVEAYFDVVGAAPSADTDCGGTSGEFAASTNLQEKTLTILAADVPASPSVLTLVLHPTDGELGDVDFYLAGLWLEGKRKCLTA
jgi:hypothetical protein